MGESENLLDNLGKKLSISRRGFVKSAAAVGAAAALYGCSKDEGGDVVYGGGGAVPQSPDAPSITEEVFAGSAPHNCGGGCVLKAYVQNGVIKRFTTDETPEKTYLDKTPGDYMQDRACPRCRSQKSWIYGSNRLMYPMIQTGKRGDLNTFRRVTWEQAAKYFKAKSESVMTNYGPGAFHQVYSSGMGGGYDSAGDCFSLAGAYSGSMLTVHDDYSFPQWDYMTRTFHDQYSQPRCNDFSDARHSEELVIWGYNLSEMLNQQQVNFTTVQMKELIKAKGGKVTVVDPRYSNTAVLAADNFIAPIQGTDTVMIFGMMHYMLTDGLDKLKAMYKRVIGRASGTEPTIDNNTDFRKLVGNYIYGFFDTDDNDGASVNESYMFDAGANQTSFVANAKVQPGTSLSAYIFGNSNALVTAGFNKAFSVYPDKIGYSVRDYKIDGEHDPLWDETTGRSKLTNCYGQVEKTPAWAATICGVSESKIKELADTFMTKDVSCWMMGGLQRNSEGDQVCWAWTILMNFVLSFGLPGRTHGRSDGRGNELRKRLTEKWKKGFGDTEILAKIPDKFKKSSSEPCDYKYLSDDKKSWADVLGDTSVLTFPDNNNSKHSVENISVFTWLDTVDATNRSEKVKVKRYTFSTGACTQVENMYNPSRWNDGQVQRVPVPTKFLFHCGGNTNINQNGDPNFAVKVFTDETGVKNNSTIPGLEELGITMNPNGYKLEFIGMIDVVMTPSCRWADLVLPGSISFERYQTHAGGRSPLTSVTTKAVPTPGDAKVEIEIGAEIAAAFGMKDAYYGNRVPQNGRTFEEEIWLNKLNDSENVAQFGMDADGWKRYGFHKTVDDLTKIPEYICYGGFLKNPGNSLRPKQTYGNRVENAVKTCFNSLSGRVEAYCLPMMENFEMRMGNNLDEGINLVNGGSLYTKIADALGKKGKGRFVYPIPMYIPLIEGRHADDTTHPDPLGLKNEGFVHNLLTWHTIYRSHSTFNSSPLVNEVKYYKRNAKGEQAFLNRNVTNTGAGLTNDKKDWPNDKNSPAVWMDDLYETVWLHPDTAKTVAKGDPIKEGDVIIIESKRGKVKVSAHLSVRIRPGTVTMTQGSWYDPIEDPVNGTVDRGGCANTLFGLRPTRIGRGMSLASECRIKIYKA